MRGGPYDERCDWWSVGVVLYILLVGRFPFYGEDDEVNAATLAGTFDFAPLESELSDAAKDLVRRLLTADVDKRFRARDIFTHRWMLPDGASHRTLSMEHLDSLKIFTAKSLARKRMIATIRKVQVTCRIKNMGNINRIRSYTRDMSGEQSPVVRQKIADEIVNELEYTKVELEQLKDEVALTQQELEVERKAHKALRQLVLLHLREPTAERTAQIKDLLEVATNRELRL